MTDEQIDLDRLTDEQREGLACVRCGQRGGRMRPIATPDNPDSTHVFAHVDPCPV